MAEELKPTGIYYCETADVYCSVKRKLKEAEDQKAELKEALEDMVEQFGYWSDGAGGFITGGLSALELAFRVLGWEEPHISKGHWCDEPGCKKRISCGTPTPDGYRSTCGDHAPRKEGNGDV